MNAIIQKTLAVTLSITLLCGYALAGSLYAVKQTAVDTLLVSIDTDNLVLREIGSLRTSLYEGGMAWDPVSQTLYAASGGRFPDLLRVDIATGEATVVERIYTLDLSGLAYDCTNNVLYAARNDGGFFSINTETAVATGFSKAPGDNNDFKGLTYDQNHDTLIGLKGSNGWDWGNENQGDLYLLEWRTNGGLSKLYDNPSPELVTSGLAFDPEKNFYWSVNHDGELYSFDPANGFQHNLRGSGYGELRALTYVHDMPCVKPPFQINYGLTDAWVNPDTFGQGFFITVYPGFKWMFVAWFTYDSERPDESLLAGIGEPGHRWITAFGGYTDNTAVLDIEITTGGVFDSPDHEPEQHLDGKMTVEFEHCNAGIITYDIPSVGKSGEVPIQRIVTDKVPLCEDLLLRTQ